MSHRVICNVGILDKLHKVSWPCNLVVEHRLKSSITRTLLPDSFSIWILYLDKIRYKCVQLELATSLE